MKLIERKGFMYLENSFKKDIEDWFHKNQRDMPWRETTNPYYIWLSEAMLQQTQVNTVIDYYYRFIHRFPTIQSLSEANEDEVLKYWEGLGYYSRARNFHTAVKEVNNNYDGEHIVNFYFNQDENLLYLITNKKELKAYIPVRSTIVNKTIESKSEIESISKNELVSNSDIVKEVNHVKDQDQDKVQDLVQEACDNVKYVARIRVVLARYKGRLGDWEEGGFIYSPRDVRDPDATVEVYDIMNGVRTLMGFAYPDATNEHNIPIYSECHSGSLRKKKDKPIAYAKNTP